MLIDKIKDEQQCFSIRSLALNGYDVMNLGFKGKQVGQVLNMLVDAMIEERVANDKNALIDFAENIKLDL